MGSTDDSGLDSSAAAAPRDHVGELLDGWQATRAQTVLATRFIANKDDYLANEPQDVGRVVGGHTRELFVSCDPAPALLQQFDHARPEFIAVHDVGTSASRKLLAGIAEATGLAVQQLVIRRQSYGTTLATLEFVEFPGQDGAGLRLYSTEADADTEARHGLARVLLAYSRLGVLMVGDLPAHALVSALKPLREDIITGPWPNRDLLLLPLASTAALASQAAELGRGTGLTVRTTPAVQRPSDAWTFISGAWGRLRAQVAAAGGRVPALNTAPAEPTPAPTAPVPAAAAAEAAAVPAFGPTVANPALQPLSLRPMPAVPQSPTRGQALDALTSEHLAHYVAQLCKLNGVIDCCVFEAASGRNIAHAGSVHDADALASTGTSLLGALVRAGRRLHLGAESPEAAITLDTRHLILRSVPRHPELMLVAVLDKARANLTLARLQILRMDDHFDSPAG